MVSLVMAVALMLSPVVWDGEEPPSIGELIAEANSYVQSSPSWTPGESSEEDSPALEEDVPDEIVFEAGVLPDAEEGEAVPYALNSTIYYGTISTAVLDLFAGIVGKYPTKDYVAFRSGSNTYDLFVGKIDLTGIFSGSDLLHVVYDATTSYNSGPYLRYNREQLQLAPGNGLVYSNLGDYPALAGVEVGFPYAKAILFGVVVLFLFLLFRWLFGRP